MLLKQLNPPKQSEVTFPWAMSQHGPIHIEKYAGEKVFCPSCSGRMIAKRGEKTRSHFAHWPQEGCGGPERIEHLLGKDIIARNQAVLIPRAFKRLHGQEYNIDEYIQKYTNPVCEKWIDGFIPDVMVTVDEKPFIIEIVVTHKTEEPKHIWIIKNNIPAIEIDCKGILSISLDDIDNYVLYKAKRKWLFSPELAKIIREKKSSQEDTKINIDRHYEIATKAEDIIKKWKTIDYQDPPLTQKEKDNYIRIKDSESPFYVSNSYIATLIKIHKNTEKVMDLISRKQMNKYVLDDEIHRLLLRYKQKDFSLIYHINMIYKLIQKKGLL